MTAPGAPTNLVAAPLQPRGVRLTWTAPASNGGSPITGYRIYRSTSAGTEIHYQLIGVATSFNDTGTAKGTRYYYRVAAVNAINTGPQSNEANARAR
jgi:fibronectin type 3 domain-containing protein